MLWLVLVATAVTVSMYYTWHQRRRLYRAHREMPCDLPCYPVVGHAYLFLGSNEDRMNTFKKIAYESLKRGGVISIWMLHKLYAVVSDPKAVEVVTKACLEKDETSMKVIRSAVGNGIAFAPESALGVELNSQQRAGHPFLHAFSEGSKTIGQRVFSPWLYFDWVFKLTPLYKEYTKQSQFIYDLFDQIIQDRRKQLTLQDNYNDEDSSINFLDLLIMSSGGDKGYSDQELRNEVMAMTMAGTDTSAVGVAFTVLMLSRHQDVHDKVYQELRSVFGDSDRPVAWEDMPKLRYLEMVIKETMRLYPPVPVIVRDVNDTVLLRSKLESGMGLLVSIWGTHRNVEYWGADAEQFRPERFLEPLQHPAQYIPFSYSVRNCLGYNYAMMSAKTSLANLLRRYVVLPPAALSPAALTAPLRVQFDIMMKHVDNYLVRLEHRRRT